MFQKAPYYVYLAKTPIRSILLMLVLGVSVER